MKEGTKQRYKTKRKKDETREEKYNLERQKLMLKSYTKWYYIIKVASEIKTNIDCTKTKKGLFKYFFLSLDLKTREKKKNT